MAPLEPRSQLEVGPSIQAGIPSAVVVEVLAGVEHEAGEGAVDVPAPGEVAPPLRHRGGVLGRSDESLGQADVGTSQPDHPSASGGDPGVGVDRFRPSGLGLGEERPGKAIEGKAECGEPGPSSAGFGFEGAAGTGQGGQAEGRLWAPHPTTPAHPTAKAQGRGRVDGPPSGRLRAT